jgi:hypothetical protein
VLSLHFKARRSYLVRTSRLILLAVAVGGALLAPASASASPNQISIMMDDDLLVYRGDNEAARTLTQMKSLGVDTVRVTLLWRVAAELANPTAQEIKAAKPGKRDAMRRQKRRFRAANPATYPIRNWDKYDNLVRKANELGIQVYFNITGPGPRFAHETAPRSQRRNQSTWKPKAGAYKQFVLAVGKRYSGTYKDENGIRTVLPRVNFWSLWNEPNQAGWLSPQWEQRGSQRIPASPTLYRKLHQRGYSALVATGHAKDTILIGETAPLGSGKQTSRSPMFPGKFLRELACVGDNGQKYTGRAASLRRCGGQVLGNGYAHHPYTKNVAPTIRPSNPDALTMANIADLGTTLDRLSATSGGVLPTALPLLVTEFGFESNPPDPFNGVPLAKQAEYNQMGEYMGYNNPRIASMAQFILRDVAPVRGKRPNTKAYWFTYQSGLFFQRGQPKPAAFAYTMPFIALPAGAEPGTGNKKVTVWGQARFLRNGAPEVVSIQWRPQGNPAGAWTTIGAPVPVDGRGFYTAARSAPTAQLAEWRAVWIMPSGALGQTSLGFPVNG